MQKSANFRASIFMLLAMGAFTLGDSITKYIVTEISSGQYIFIRALFATILIGLLAWHRGALRKLTIERMTMIRVLAEVFATVSYVYALQQLSQAFSSAVFQSTPLVVTLGAVIFLQEKVGWRRWFCILTGLLGVLIIIRPGNDSAARMFDIGVLLASVIFASMRDLATRRIPTNVPTLYISFLSAAAITVTGALLIEPMGGWQPVRYSAWAFILAAALLLLIGFHFIILAMREGEISFVTPFRYSSLLWAILLSTIIFAEAPDKYTIAGSILVVGSGIYMVYRESSINRRKLRTSVLDNTSHGS